MRIGEACTLEWKDIDFENKTISISKTLLRTKQYDRKKQKLRKERIYITSPKSYTSKRAIPLSDFVAYKFLKWKTKQDKDKTRNRQWGSTNYLLEEYPELIFTTKTGKSLTPGEAWVYCLQGVNRVNEEEVFMAEMQHRDPELLVLHPHIFRHTYATRCVEYGLNPNAIQKLLGHATLDMLSVYAHPSTEFLKEECKKYNFYYEKEVLGDKYEEGMTVIDVKYLYPYGAFSGKFPLTMTFNVTGVTSSSKVQVLAYNDETGQWEVVECTVGNGTVTAVLNSLSLVAFVADGKTAGTINTATSTGSGSNTSTVSPKTGEGNTMMMVAMFAAIGLAGMTVVVAGRKRA